MKKLLSLKQFSKYLCICVCCMKKGSWTPTTTNFKQKLKMRRKLRHERYKRSSLEQKPDWLTQWTISKGWLHDRSHLLTLGLTTRGSKENKKLTVEEDVTDGSSVENASDLISIIDHFESDDQHLSPSERNEEFCIETNNDEISGPSSRSNDLYTGLNVNYRQHFPSVNNKEKSDVKYTQISFPLTKKFNKYETLDDLRVIEQLEPEQQQQQRESSPPRCFSVQQDTIYECSENDISLYDNPIYESNSNRRSDKNVYFVRHRHCNRSKFTSHEKHVIRHIRIRIMLTLRLKKFQRLYRKKMRRKCLNGKKSESGDVSDIRKVHEEQWRISNGRSSLKIQNLRYGRLNVLRWLLWETREQGRALASPTQTIPSTEKNWTEMPALERQTANNHHSNNNNSSNSLALHYAAARGCLDCVRLLVDTSNELSANTQMDNDVTPVYLAAQEGHLEVLKFLVLEAGGSLYVRAKDGMAPLHAASQMGCLNCVKWMIQDQGVDPNLRDGDGATPLHFAASRGHLETVRWLLRHGARLSLDKYGKSPINDAAENQQVECLNVLVQHGATPDYNDSDISIKRSCSCNKKIDSSNRNDCMNCMNNNNNNNKIQEPFFLHPPHLVTSRAASVEAPHAPQDGLYINPMNNHRHSASSSSGSCSGDSVNGEAFFLHNPQEVIYNRVRDLFENKSPKQQQKQQTLSALTVKVEVHSSSSGAGSEENLSSSDLSERSGDHDHDYEDIYMTRKESKNKERSRSRDSGSHSRSGSASSHNSSGNVTVKLTPTATKTQEMTSTIKKPNEFLPKPQKYEKVKKDETKVDVTSSNPGEEKTKLATRHSLQSPKAQKQLSRVVSVPVEGCPPPPPPPPLPTPSPEMLGKKETEESDEQEHDVEATEELTVKPSSVIKGRTNAAKRLNSSCSDLTIISLQQTSDSNEEFDNKPTVPNLVNKQRVLPFIPPSFPGVGSDSNNLIKPSEYLRSISDKRASIASRCSDYDDKDQNEVVKEEFETGPPPPPLPPPEDINNNSNQKELNKKQQQPLSSISIQDLNSVQLRRTDNKMPATKTFSTPTRSLSLQCLQSENYLAQKNDLISELKLSKDISGIKKMKVERSKMEEKHERELITEITKQFSVNNFVEKVPGKDPTGNAIPEWKRQMLAKKAAERARRELEEQLQKEAESKRLQGIPQWKRQLLAKKEETEIKIKSTIYTPKVNEDMKPVMSGRPPQEPNRKEDEIINATDLHTRNKENSKPESNVETVKTEVKVVEPNIIPWRAQLRKTNSKLNLLD